MSTLQYESNRQVERLPEKESRTRRPRRRVRRLIGAALAGVVLSLAYLVGGSAGKSVRVEYELDLRAPESGLIRVTMTIHPPVRPYVTLWLRDSIQDGRRRVRIASVRRAERSLPNWRTFPGTTDMRNVWTGFGRDPVEVVYEVDPKWVKGRSPKCFLGPDFGYFRGMTTLFTPVTPRAVRGLFGQTEIQDRGGGRAELRFSLPEGWTVVSPWGDGLREVPLSGLRNTYFGVGPFSVSSVRAGESSLVLGVYDGLGERQKDRLSRGIPRLFETIAAATEVSPRGLTPSWALTVLPAEPIGGGASGVGSLVTSNRINVIAHEMFHWWNGATIVSVPEANWIKEGFTSYYEGKMLLMSGIWSLQEFTARLAGFRAGLWEDGDPGPVNLIRASVDLVRRGAVSESEKVYSGGALVAWYLDRELQKQDKSLDGIWERLLDTGKPVTPALFFDVLGRWAGAELARECEARVSGRRPLEDPEAGKRPPGR
jgi:hypothetical protein